MVDTLHVTLDTSSVPWWIQFMLGLTTSSVPWWLHVTLDTSSGPLWMVDTLHVSLGTSSVLWWTHFMLRCTFFDHDLMLNLGNGATFIGTLMYVTSQERLSASWHDGKDCCCCGETQKIPKKKRIRFFKGPQEDLFSFRHTKTRILV